MHSNKNSIIDELRGVFSPRSVQVKLQFFESKDHERPSAAAFSRLPGHANLFYLKDKIFGSEYSMAEKYEALSAIRLNKNNLHFALMIKNFIDCLEQLEAEPILYNDVIDFLILNAHIPALEALK